MAAVGIAVGLLVVFLAVAPLVVPLPPLRETVPPEELADPNSRFVRLNGVQVHYKTAGSGKPGFVLLHGFGASTFSWREVVPAFAEWGTTVGFDRPGFGLTERPLAWTGENPYAAQSQVALTLGLMDSLGIDKAVLVGHSAGGEIALLTALIHPERVAALVLVAPAVGAGGGLPAWLRSLLATPQARRLGPLLVRRIRDQGRTILQQSWHDPHLLTPEVIAGYEIPLRAENWDRGLWEFTLAAGPTGVSDRLAEIRVPTLVVTCDDDRIVPMQRAAELANTVPDAELVVLAACGHLPHEERPQAFLDAVASFLARHGLISTAEPSDP
ncbi:MAG: alpha/beta fold hydrolase [Candidatus Bipolaricaulota bacterium]|nr:alpha/beta hydrolase [Candidatus Bipolaricaulota bacterium]